jgi:predicted nucleic-acid-binding Zn-ribbon protein
MENKDRCPNCNSTSYASLDAIGSDFAALIVHEIGKVNPSVCLDCGTVYLKKRDLYNIQERRGWRKKNDQ